YGLLKSNKSFSSSISTFGVKTAFFARTGLVPAPNAAPSAPSAAFLETFPVPAPSAAQSNPALTVDFWLTVDF
ncbi:hypothetical protein A2U01_0094616, partial [Trifolium medium]|nr:hypothetical protein [Trifolium medium]